MNDVAVLAQNEPALREQAQAAYRTLRLSGWQLALYCHRIVAERSYLAWGFTSANAWATVDLPAIARNLTHYCAMGRHLLALPADQRDAWMQFPVWNVIAAGKWLEQAPQQVLKALQEGRTKAQMQQAAAAALPDQHHEHEWRTIHLRVSKPVYEKWQQAVCRAEYEACKAEPTADDVVECIATALLNEPLWQPANGIESEAWWTAVHTGQVQCRECGGKNRTVLTWHHTVARSAQGHESIQVPLCLACHDRIQPRWRDWLAEHDLKEEI
jgi:hypothetical protein